MRHTGEWDIGAYDKCKKSVEDNWARGNISDSNLEDAYKECCSRTGGNWDNSKKACVAPPANPAQAPFRPLPQAPILTATPVPGPEPAAPPPMVIGPG